MTLTIKTAKTARDGSERWAGKSTGSDQQRRGKRWDKLLQTFNGMRTNGEEHADIHATSCTRTTALVHPTPTTLRPCPCGHGRKSWAHVVQDTVRVVGGVLWKELEVVIIDVDCPAVLGVGRAAVELDALEESGRPRTYEPTKSERHAMHAHAHTGVVRFWKSSKTQTNERPLVRWNRAGRAIYHRLPNRKNRARKRPSPLSPMTPTSSPQRALGFRLGEMVLQSRFDAPCSAKKTLLDKRKIKRLCAGQA